MIHSGLVSISFRKMSPAGIVAMTAAGGLEGIEWGGDVHVPHGDLPTARAVRAMTEDAGLRVPSYGSYYRAGEPAVDANPDFQAVLESAVALGAPVIRVWCGKRGSAGADEAYRATVTADLDRIGEMARRAGIAIGCEFHGGTLTDTNASAMALFRGLHSANVHPYWQPPGGQSMDYCRDGLTALLPRLLHVHVFHWTEVAGKRERRPLAEGSAPWAEWLRLVAGTGRDHWALLEFVRDDSPAQFAEDAKTLRTWLADLQG